MDFPNQITVVSEPAAAAAIGASSATLRRMRAAKTGPKHLRLSARRIAYRVADLDEWLETRTIA